MRRGCAGLRRNGLRASLGSAREKMWIRPWSLLIRLDHRLIDSVT
ncbi:hypothetical protein C7S16_2385 [Burkholderia thailandensis]|uniref:Uncharacterized protein n=1 Tax=Burkholderia thailandensis TaxID=57975 RepID=A0AAW9D2H2_BURTH|nr:hypothetical protein [Burkholderia thailandensis]MDW9255693.1 hypothetical protein [Burkholderia thailandensis]